MTLTTRAVLTRDAILATGEDLILEKGFSGVGLQEILSSCGVPKGSFYHYFSSKEGFGVAVLDRYVETYLSTVEGVLQRPGTARERIGALAAAWAGTASGASADRCLVVKLSAEVATISESMRSTLADGVSRLIDLLAAAVSDGYRDGSIVERRSAHRLAEALYELWLGAALLDRLRRDGSSFAASISLTEHLFD